MSEYAPIAEPPRQTLAPGVRVRTTSRAGGVGITSPTHATFGLGLRSGDDAAAVHANRARLQRLLALPSAPQWPNQVHGTQVVCAERIAQNGVVDADAVWTDVPGQVCAVLTADCLPVVIARQDGTAVAVAHAGWRGLVAGVLEAAVAALGQGPCNAWLGPAIGPHRFEVGPEVRAAFLANHPMATSAFRAGRGDRWLCNLYLLARQRLRTAGVVQIRGGGHCTVRERERYFSHRRDGPATGRMATLAWIEPAQT